MKMMEFIRRLFFRPMVCERCGRMMVTKQEGIVISGHANTTPPTLSRRFGRCYECGK